MKSFYTIIKIAPNTMTDDSLSIGMLGFDGSRYWLRFSEERKSAIKKIIEEKKSVVDFIIRQMESFVSNLNSTSKNITDGLFQFETLLKSEYFDYLKRYSNGLLRFSSVSYLHENMNDENFGKIFSLLIDDSFDKNLKMISYIIDDSDRIIEEKLIQKVETKIHTKTKIDATVLSTMYFEYEMDCIGKNGALVGAKYMSFERKFKSVDKDISHYIALISLLSTYYNMEIKKNKFYLIANEPHEVNSEIHKTWENIIENPLFKVINTDQVNEVAETVDITNASKFLPAS
jgi:hypothetical protein